MRAEGSDRDEPFLSGAKGSMMNQLPSPQFSLARTIACLGHRRAARTRWRGRAPLL